MLVGASLQTTGDRLLVGHFELEVRQDGEKNRGGRIGDIKRCYLLDPID